MRTFQRDTINDYISYYNLLAINTKKQTAYCKGIKFRIVSMIKKSKSKFVEVS